MKPFARGQAFVQVIVQLSKWFHYRVFFMDKERFIADFKDKKGQEILRTILNSKGWFIPDEKQFKLIKYLAKIGCLFIDPIKGIKVNNDFIPKNQIKRNYLRDV